MHRRTVRRRAATLLAPLLAAAGLALVAAPPAAAHPLGNFTVNGYDGLTVSPRNLRVDHVEDLAEIPAAQAEPRIDEDGDGRSSADERGRWARRMCERAARRTRTTVDGRALEFASRDDRARALRRPGEAGLHTLRLECLLTAPLTLAGEGATDDVTSLRFTGATAVGEAGPGWREITARGDRTRLERNGTPARSASARLTRYPDGTLTAPPRQRTAALGVRRGGPALGAGDADAGEDGATGARALARGADGLTERFTDLVGGHRLTLGFGLVAFLLAMLLGAAHALAPGHGKTVMAAYVAGGRRRSLPDVLRIGAAVTVTHTAGVLILGLLVVGGSRVTPSALPWLTVLSGVLVALAGTALLRRALTAHGAHGHGHADIHGHGHQGHHHAHAHPHVHPHGPRTRDTLLLGFAGGLVPSPSAVLVLVGSSALGQLWFGVLLVTAYGVGLALTLVAVAVLLVRAGARLGRRLMSAAPRYERLFGVLHRRAPTGTAALVVLLGAFLTLRGLAAVA
ncbi:nickel/cobalt transporter [Streptomyces sp. NPDC054796]